MTRALLEKIIAGHEREANTPGQDAIIEQTVAAIRAFAVTAGIELDRDTVLITLFGSIVHQAVMIELGTDVDGPETAWRAVNAIGWVQVALSRIAGAES